MLRSHYESSASRFKQSFVFLLITYLAVFGTPMPNPKAKQFLEGEPELRLSQLADFVSKRELCSSLYAEAVKEWGTYFQSPVNKVAHTEKPIFQFDEWGALRDADSSIALGSLAKALNVKPDAIRDWLSVGNPLSPETVNVIKRRLREKTLTNESLYSQPICRLVHANQLRRDLDYQIIYQLTPGQSRLVNPQNTSSNRAPSLPEVMRNQEVYWGISETFQSLVAMFDSDLGSRKEYWGGKDTVTKEFIRIRLKRDPGSPLAPDELNKSSPLRFWSPPPVFAGSVFHMLFWRSIITGSDLFRRPVIQHGSDSLKARADQYYVIINWFNAAKFRLADYAKLFEALMTIARRLRTARIAGSRKKADDKTLLAQLQDVDLSGSPSKELLYPSYFPNSAVKFAPFQKVSLTLPFHEMRDMKWELPRDHQSDKNAQTLFPDVLKFLRDKALELIIWSKYQMEIRSVGLIPIQYLYHVELTESGQRELAKLSKKWKQLDGKKQAYPKSDLARILETEINDSLFAAIKSGQIDSWIKLRRIYGGTYRTVYDVNALKNIERLKSPRVKNDKRTRNAKKRNKSAGKPRKG